ncbi:hypothetical protein GCWU000325_00120 [Alloprevotella tannerae ATCC 51259]|uniref:Uncharacterized protein n=1 Tax=Alloprevotella tannerae ATCC 51259 TaxID=626522 RepID=C9LD27_9BACT|nr:hypothetical protein GCWU000325_00120 [Alloprevotella tannerae ATCC 51259]
MDFGLIKHYTNTLLSIFLARYALRPKYITTFIQVLPNHKHIVF